MSKRYGMLKKKGYLWATLALFFISIVLHWAFGWTAFKKEEQEHGHVPQFSEYSIEAMRDTMENWQSEFLQLVWQVAGLSFLWYVGSPSSKEGDERKEAKIDYLIRKLDPKEGERILAELEEKYPKK